MTTEKRRKRHRLTELHWSWGPSELRVRHDDSDKEAKTLIRRENDTETDENIHRVRRKRQISLTMIVKEIHDCSNIRSDARNSTARRMSVVSFLYYLLVMHLITDVVVVIRDIWKASDIIHESRIDLWSILSSPSIMHTFRQRSSLYYRYLTNRELSIKSPRQLDVCIDLCIILDWIRIISITLRFLSLTENVL